jgi:hypothetical protein
VSQLDDLTLAARRLVALMAELAQMARCAERAKRDAG